MTIVAGFELPEGKTRADLAAWPSFAEWWESQYGFKPMPRDSKVAELFNAYLAGAYWEFERRTFPEAVTTT